MIIDKINELCNLTAQEQAVREYIIENERALIELSITQIAEQSYTSTSTIVRLCKKLDLKGYSELRNIYASEFSAMQNQKSLLKIQVFNSESTLDEIVDTLPLLYVKAVDYTRSMIDRNMMIRMTNQIKRADRIEIYACGLNYDIAKTISFRFESMGKDCYAYNTPHWEHIEMLKIKNIKTVAIFLSHTGKNPMVIYAAKLFKDLNMHTISITDNKNSELATLTEDHIQVVNLLTELELKTAVFIASVNYIFDIFTSSLLVYNHSRVTGAIDNLDGSRENW